MPYENYIDPQTGSAMGPQWTFTSAVGGHAFGTMPELPQGYSRVEYERERAFTANQYIGGAAAVGTSLAAGGALGYFGFMQDNALTRMRQAAVWGGEGVAFGGLRGMATSWVGKPLGTALGGAVRATAWGVGEVGHMAATGMGNAISRTGMGWLSQGAGAVADLITPARSAVARDAVADLLVSTARASKGGEAAATAMQSALKGMDAYKDVVNLAKNTEGISRKAIVEAIAKGRANSWGTQLAGFVRSPFRSMAGGMGALAAEGVAGVAAGAVGLIAPLAAEMYMFDKVAQFATNPLERYLDESSLERDMFEKSNRILKPGRSDAEMGLSGGFTAAQQTRFMGTVKRMAESSSKGMDWMGFGSGGHFGGHTAYSGRFRELSNLFNVGTDLGLLDSKSMDDFEKKFKQLVDIADKLGKVMKGGKEKIAVFLREMDSMGFHDLDTAGKNLGYVNYTASARGTTVERVMAESKAGASYFQQMGAAPRMGAIEFQRWGYNTDLWLDKSPDAKALEDAYGGREGITARLAGVGLQVFQSDQAMQEEMAFYVDRDKSGRATLDVKGFLTAMGTPVTKEMALERNRARSLKWRMQGPDGQIVSNPQFMKKKEMISELLRRGDISNDMINYMVRSMTLQSIADRPEFANMSEEERLRTGLTNMGYLPGDLAAGWAQGQTGGLEVDKATRAQMVVRDQIQNRQKELAPKWLGISGYASNALGMAATALTAPITSFWGALGFSKEREEMKAIRDRIAADLYSGTGSPEDRDDLKAAYLKWKTGARTNDDIAAEMTFDKFMRARSVGSKGTALVGATSAAMDEISAAAVAMDAGRKSALKDPSLSERMYATAVANVISGKKEAVLSGVFGSTYDSASRTLGAYMTPAEGASKKEIGVVNKLKYALSGRDRKLNLNYDEMEIAGRYITSALAAGEKYLPMYGDAESVQLLRDQAASLSGLTYITGKDGTVYRPDDRKILAAFGGAAASAEDAKNLKENLAVLQFDPSEGSGWSGILSDLSTYTLTKKAAYAMIGSEKLANNFIKGSQPGDKAQDTLALEAATNLFSMSTLTKLANKRKLTSYGKFSKEQIIKLANSTEGKLILRTGAGDRLANLIPRLTSDNPEEAAAAANEAMDLFYSGPGSDNAIRMAGAALDLLKSTEGQEALETAKKAVGATADEVLAGDASQKVKDFFTSYKQLYEGGESKAVLDDLIGKAKDLGPLDARYSGFELAASGLASLGNEKDAAKFLAERGASFGATTLKEWATRGGIQLSGSTPEQMAKDISDALAKGGDPWNKLKDIMAQRYADVGAFMQSTKQGPGAATDPTQAGGAGAMDLKGMPAFMQQMGAQTGQTVTHLRDAAIIIEKVTKEMISRGW